MWPDRLFEIELPIVQAPMAGAVGPELIIAAAEAGGHRGMFLTDKVDQQPLRWSRRWSAPFVCP